MVAFDSFRQDLATSLLRCADRRRPSRAGGTSTGEDIKVVALLERLADDVKNLDLHVFLIFELMFTHKRLARRYLQQHENLLAQVGVLYCPSSATDLVRWLTRHVLDDDREDRSPRSHRSSPVGVLTPPGGPGSRRGSSDGQRHGFPRSCVSEFSAGIGIVAPLLSLWNVRAALEQMHDRSFMAQHAAVPATVISVSPVGAGRNSGAASDVVLAFQQPATGEACRVTWRSGLPAFAGTPGAILTVVPRSSACELPLIPSQVGDPMHSFALAAALMAGGFSSLKLWTWLSRRATFPVSRPVWLAAGKRRHDLA